MNTASAAATVVSAASKASNFATQTVETARTEVLKEPLGFIKIIQVLIAIITFAVAVNGGDTIKFATKCTANDPQTSVSATYSYPYDLANTQWYPKQFCSDQPENKTTIADSSTSIVASAGFFVFTGVISFLYSLVFIIIYVFFKHKYERLVFFPLVDFAITCLITLFWFAGSIAWSKAVDDLKDATDADTIRLRFTTCTQRSCLAVSPYPTYASVVISCIFGFGNVLLWGGNTWFVLKETGWYKARAQAQQQQQQQQQQSATASYNPNNKI